MKIKSQETLKPVDGCNCCICENLRHEKIEEKRKIVKKEIMDYLLRKLHPEEFETIKNKLGEL